MPGKYAGTPEHNIWRGMRRRCRRERARDYAAYGGAGICVCGGWRTSFMSFFEDMGPRPSLDHSVDRIDGGGHYSCGHCEDCEANGWSLNCRWATRGEQNRNRKDNRMLTFEGETMCLADWAKRIGMSKGGLHDRLTRMSVEEALRTPVRQWRSNQQLMQVPLSARDSEWCREAARRGLLCRGVGVCVTG